MKRTQGVALITALLVVAIATLAATQLLSSANVAIHRAASLRDSEEGGWVARGVEAWVLGILDKDRKEHRYDGLDEAWAQPVDHLPVDQGFVRGQVVDLQGRFNLNNLAREFDKDQRYAKQFEQLIGGLKVQPPQGLVAAIQDWIDTDQTPGAGGAEDSAYMQLNPPYRAANQPFTVVSELLAVQGVTPELYGALKDLVCAVPSQNFKVNVNTAPVPLLIALGIDAAKASDWETRRKDQPVTSDADKAKFVAEYVPAGGTAKPDDLGYTSNFFQVQGEVFVGGSRVALYSLIYRPDSGPPTVLAHSADAE